MEFEGIQIKVSDKEFFFFFFVLNIFGTPETWIACSA